MEERRGGAARQMSPNATTAAPTGGTSVSIAERCSSVVPGNVATHRRSPGRARPDQLHRYADGRRVDKKLSLSGFHHRRINHQRDFADDGININSIENFRGYAKRLLKACHGGLKRNLRLFIREMEFRLNRRDADNPLYILISRLRAC
ncbi:MAG: hypothetical protein GF399_12605 [Candidatus Coatesbacteria bacterium]|nr:hypothetical protein [Candidatus Coatesbacteria bacterium]